MNLQNKHEPEKTALPFPPLPSSIVNSVLVKAIAIHLPKEKEWNTWESESQLFCTEDLSRQRNCKSKYIEHRCSDTAVRWVMWSPEDRENHACNKQKVFLTMSLPVSVRKESDPKDFSEHLALFHWDATHSTKQRESLPLSYDLGHSCIRLLWSISVDCTTGGFLYSCGHQETKLNKFQVVSGVSHKWQKKVL